MVIPSRTLKRNSLEPVRRPTWLLLRPKIIVVYTRWELHLTIMVQGQACLVNGDADVTVKWFSESGRHQAICTSPAYMQDVKVCTILQLSVRTYFAALSTRVIVPLAT